MKSFFVVFNSADPLVVEREWEAFCSEDTTRRRNLAIQKLKTEGMIDDADEGTEHYETAIYEYIIYNGVPLSFDGYKILFVARSEWIESDNQDEIRKWILWTHKKWEPALAVPLNDQTTIVGGWVST